MKRCKGPFQKVIVRLDMLDDVGLVVEDERVEDVEGCGVFEGADENDVFEVLEAEGLVDLVADGGVFDLYSLSEVGGV